MFFSFSPVSVRPPRRWKLAALFLLIPVLCAGLAAGAQSRKSYFASLEKRLIRDGFDAKTIHAIYRGKRVRFDVKDVSRYFAHRESRLDYGQFTKKAPIRKARAFLAAHAKAFAWAEAKTGVDPKVITAILLVETRFGKYAGSDSILNTLSTMAALEEPRVLEAFWKQVPSKRKLKRSVLEEKAKSKSAWAYDELKALLTYAQREHIAPGTILGSYAGAMGIAQFMPSNVLTLGMDGDQDGRIDLFDPADAIASVANYLKHYGWHPGMNRQAAYKVILHYNHSSYYANTVLKIVDLLKES